MNETLTPKEFRVEGEKGLGDEFLQWSGGGSGGAEVRRSKGANSENRNWSKQAESRGDGLLSEVIQGNICVHIMYTSEVCLCRGRL